MMKRRGTISRPRHITPGDKRGPMQRLLEEKLLPPDRSSPITSSSFAPCSRPGD